MFAIDTSSAVPALPAPQTPGTPGFFGRGNVQTGARPTTMSADWCNMIQGELLTVIEAAGETPSKTNFGQLLAAIQVLAGVGVTVKTSGSITEITIALGSYFLKLFTGPTPSGANFNSTTQTFLTPFPNACLLMAGGGSDSFQANSSWHPVNVWFPASGWAKTGFIVEADTVNVNQAVAAGLTFSGIAFGN